MSGSGDVSAQESTATAAVAAVFGRETTEDASLRSALCEAGLSEAGANGVVSDLNDGWTAEEAVSSVAGCSWAWARQNSVASLVEEAALAVVRRHRGVMPATTAPVSEGRRPAAVQAAVAELQSAREVYLHGRVAKSEIRGVAESFVKGAVSYATECAVREGWADDQLAGYLRSMVPTMRGLAADTMSSTRPSVLVVSEAETRAAVEAAFARRARR